MIKKDDVAGDIGILWQNNQGGDRFFSYQSPT